MRHDEEDIRGDGQLIRAASREAAAAASVAPYAMGDS